MYWTSSRPNPGPSSPPTQKPRASAGAFFVSRFDKPSAGSEAIFAIALKFLILCHLARLLRRPCHQRHGPPPEPLNILGWRTTWRRLFLADTAVFLPACVNQFSSPGVLSIPYPFQTIP